MNEIINIINRYFNLVKCARIENLSKEQFLNRIRKYIHEPATYFAHFSDSLTIGANNRSTYGTPAGIYGYLMDADFLSDMIDFQYMYAKKRNYIHVFKKKNSDKKTLFIKDYSEDDFQNDLQKLKKRFGNELINKGLSDINDAESSHDYRYDLSPFNKLWLIIKNMDDTSYGFSDPFGAVAVPDLKAKHVLLLLGYDGVVDEYQWKIHTAQPAQAVFLSMLYIDHVDIIDNYYRNKEKEKTLTNKNVNEIKNIKDDPPVENKNQFSYNADRYRWRSGPDKITEYLSNNNITLRAKDWLNLWPLLHPIATYYIDDRYLINNVIDLYFKNPSKINTDPEQIESFIKLKHQDNTNYFTESQIIHLLNKFSANRLILPLKNDIKSHGNEFILSVLHQFLPKLSNEIKKEFVANLFDDIDMITETDLLKLNDPIITKLLNPNEIQSSE